jgi:dienelactone hydrolase
MVQSVSIRGINRRRCSARPEMHTALLLLGLFVAAAASAEVHVLQTTDGIRFGIIGSKPANPCPTVFLFANSLEETLQNTNYNEIGRRLAAHGFLQVSMDLPSHGADQPLNEKNSLKHWRDRLERGDDFLPPFLAHASSVLRYLIDQGYTDPQRIAVCGTSRGGFIALHFAAVEPRVRAAAAFAPVTDLVALTEFAGMESHARTRALALVQVADRLADRAVWITIGSTDHRVGTEYAIALLQRVVEASEARGRRPQIQLHIMPTEGHRIHPSSHEEAASWMLRQMGFNQ